MSDNTHDDMDRLKELLSELAERLQLGVSPEDEIDFRNFALDHIDGDYDPFFAELVARMAFDITRNILEYVATSRNYSVHVDLAVSPRAGRIELLPKIDDERAARIENGVEPPVPAVSFPEMAIVDGLFRNTDKKLNNHFRFYHQIAATNGFEHLYQTMTTFIRKSELMAYLLGLLEAIESNSMELTESISNSLFTFLNERSPTFVVSKTYPNQDVQTFFPGDDPSGNAPLN